MSKCPRSIALAGWPAIAVAAAVAALFPVQAQAAAFPRAVGFGAVATGGRGGRVLHVTTLSGSGTGSLAWAVSQTGARIIVFDVSGVIEGDVEITSGSLTIAGQTAPGAGITIHGHLFTPYGANLENMIIRHIRVRPPGPAGDWTPEQHDAIQMSDVHKVVFDHVDVSHAVDENVDHWNGGSEITWQNSILSFPNPDGGHGDGAHPFCLINSDGDTGGGEAGGRISVVGNLFAHCRTRTPALSIGPSEVINNVVYDGREGFVHHNPAYGDFVIAGNTYKDGPSYSLVPFWFDAENSSPPTRYFVGDNMVDDPGVFSGLVGNPFQTPGFTSAYSILDSYVESSQFQALSTAPSWPSPHVNVTRVAPADAYTSVLACAGAWPRDFVSTLAVQETTNRTGSVRNLAQTNLLQGLTPGTRPTDTDNDGMPDAWETAHGLNPATDDHNTMMGGWSALEVYLEERSDAISCSSTTPPTTGTGGSSGGGGVSGTAGASGGAGTSGAAGRGGSSGAAGMGGRGGSSGAAGTTGAAGMVGRGGSTGLAGTLGGGGAGSVPAAGQPLMGGCACDAGGAHGTAPPGAGLVGLALAVTLAHRRERPRRVRGGGEAPVQ